MDGDRDPESATKVQVIGERGVLDFERLIDTLNKLNPQFKCEICLQDQFVLKPAGNDASAACLPFYNLKNPSLAVGVRFFVELMCMTCGNTKLLDREFLEKSLAHEG
jgi:hypothetical protein